jgi:phosphoribosylanthranilate isomerase
LRARALRSFAQPPLKVVTLDAAADAATHLRLLDSVNRALVQRHSNREPLLFIVVHSRVSWPAFTHRRAPSTHQAHAQDATAELMALKNHLDLAQVTSRDVDMNMKGVGFLLIGKTLDPKTCADVDLEAHDEALGWGINFRSRVQDKLKVCV